MTYSYKAAGKDGKIVSGKINATDEDAAQKKLSATYLRIYSIEEIPEKKGMLSMEIGSKKIKLDKLSLMCSQFAILLRSGTPAAECVHLIRMQTQSKKLAAILEGVERDVTAGHTMAASFRRHGAKAFPETFFETIKAGEDTGDPAQSFQMLHEYFDNQNRTTKKVKSAFIYPIFVIVVAIAVLVVVMVKVIPSLSATFDQFGGDLPGITKFMIGFSKFFQANWWWMLIILIALIVLYQVIYHTPKGRLKIDAMKMHIPVIGKISGYSNAANFAYTMSMLYRAGITLPEALKVVGRTFKNSVLKAATEEVAEGVRNGQKMSACMRKTGVFPITLTEMTAAGENSGELEDTLKVVADYYYNEVDMATKNALAKLEPVLLILVALFAIFLVLAIYLPLFYVYDFL